MSNWINVVLSAFGLSVLFFYAPAITVVAGLILVVYYHNQEIANVAGKVVGFVQLLALAFITAVVTQVLLTIVFGASFQTLVASGGLLAALQNPAAITSAVTKEVLALVVVLCAVYLMVTATTPQRWLFKVAMALSLLALTFQCWNVGTAGSQARHQMRLTLLTEEVLANISVRLKDFGLGLNRDTVFKEHRANMPTIYFALSDAYLYAKDGEGLKRGEPVKLGSRWFHLVDGQTISHNEISYLPVASFDDEKVTGWLRADRMSESEPSTPKVEALTPPVEELVAANPVKPAVVAPAVCQPSFDLAIENGEISEELVEASVGQWIATRFIPRNGELVKLGYFESAEDINRLQARIGKKVLTKINPKQDGVGWYTDIMVTGPNSANEPLEISVKRGLPLMVSVSI